jgi:hypothetical protein
MVCFVHDRQFLSKFHAAVNKLRQTNQFTTATLRQLPKQCCSCPEKRADMVSTGAEPLLTSLDFDALRLICLRLDLKQCINVNVSSSSSKMLDYTILPFPTSYQSRKQSIVANQFIMRHDNQLVSLQEMYHVRLDFITSNISEELLNDVIQCQFDLVTKCSNYLEAKQIINGLWVIISIEDQAHIDIVKHELQKQWGKFLTAINMYSRYTIYNGRENLPQLLTISTCLNLQRSKTRHQTVLKEQEVKHSVKRILQRRDNTDEDLIENMLVSDQTRLRFLSNRFENSSKSRQPRTHRRQHILALALIA